MRCHDQVLISSAELVQFRLVLLRAGEAFDLPRCCGFQQPNRQCSQSPGDCRSPIGPALDCQPKRFTDAQRARLGRKAKVLGRTRLRGMATLATPDTFLRWFHRLVAQKWTFAKSHPLGRPTVASELEKLAVKLIQDNPTLGSNRIAGALANLGHTLSDVTIDNIRRRNGFNPAPIRGKKSSWRRFLKAHWETLLAADFFTTEVLSWRGLMTHYTLIIVDLRSSAVHVCGSTVSPNGEWMKAASRQLVDAVDGFALGKTHLIIDRDTQYG